MWGRKLFLLVAAGWLVAWAVLPGGRVRASSKQGQQAGAVLFRETGCEYCHGVEGVGTDKGPALVSIGREWKRPMIEHQIVKGGGGMPAFADDLKPEELNDLLDYLQTKRLKVKKKKAKADTSTALSQSTRPS